MEFRHALAAIQFKTGDAMLGGKVKKITLSGVYKEGKHRIGTAEWTATGDPLGSYEIEKVVEFDIKDKTPDSDPDHREDNHYTDNNQQYAGVDDNLTLFMIPQELPEGAKITMLFTDELTGLDRTLTADLAGLQWEAGKLYSYSLSTTGIVLNPVVKIVRCGTESFAFADSIPFTGVVRDVELTAYVEVTQAEENVIELKIDEIRSNPYQPRKIFDEAGLAELAESIKQQGVFQPIIVRSSSVMGYELIAGERRYRASKLAGKKTIPAIVRQLDEEEMMEIAVLENLQREDLTPLEEAQAYNTLMENLHLTQAQVSKRLGKSRPYIANYLRLLSLPQEVKAMLQEGQLSMGQARTLLSLKDKKNLVQLAKKTVKENLTVRQLEQLVSEQNGEKHHKKAAKRKVALDPHLQKSEDLLKERFGTNVAIKSTARSKKGKIEISYLSMDDLNRILDILDIHLD